MIKGIVRNIDHLGRIVIPKEMRRTLKINNGDPVDIYVRNEIICLGPCKLKCVCCGKDDESKLVEKNGVLLCTDCVNDFFSKTY